MFVLYPAHLTVQVDLTGQNFDAAVIVKTLGEAFSMLNETGIPLVWVTPPPPSPLQSCISP